MHENEIVRKSYIWYSIGGLLNAGQSALLLMVISRTNKPEDAGIYSIGYAIACLAITVGNFGVRNYQSTDINHKYTFSNYLSYRVMTDTLMLILILFYIFRGFLCLDYSIEKCVDILLLGILKIIDSIEDVFHGMYQNRGRLDIAGICMSLRLFLTLSGFSIALVITKCLYVSALIAIFVSLVFFVISTKSLLNKFEKEIRIKLFDNSNCKICIECISLFIGSFLSIYIANAPKYAIDELCSEIEQANFNYIFMPVYVVSVINSFIYQPVLTKMASYYGNGDIRLFLKLFFKQIFGIIVLVALVLVGGYFWGIPVLNIFYNTELQEYKKALIILLIGSGFLATSGYISAIITILRKQNWLLWGYGMSAFLALLFSKEMVMLFGVDGAAFLYLGIMVIQIIIFIFLFVIIFNKEKKKLNNAWREK